VNGGNPARNDSAEWTSELQGERMVVEQAEFSCRVETKQVTRAGMLPL